MSFRPEYWMEYGSRLKERGIHVPLMTDEAIDEETVLCLSEGMLDYVISTAECIKMIGEVKSVIVPSQYINVFIIRTEDPNIDLRKFPVEILEVGKKDTSGQYSIWLQLVELVH